MIKGICHFTPIVIIKLYYLIKKVDKRSKGATTGKLQKSDNTEVNTFRRRNFRIFSATSVFENVR